MKKKLLAAVFGAVLVLGACGGGDKSKEDEGTTGGEVAVDAEAVFTKSCIQCHGENLEGVGSYPALNEIGAKLSEEEIHDVIVNGQGSMPPGLIKGEEADAVAEWLAAKK